MAGVDLWAECSKYKVHPECNVFIQRITELGVQPYSALTVTQGREQSSSASQILAGTIDFPGSTKEIIVPSPHSSSGIPISVYHPVDCPAVPAILVYFHGGGLVLGSRKSHQTMLQILSRDSCAIIVNVEYRLLPNPDAVCAPFDDAEVVTRWILANKEALGGIASSKVGVGGDSAGGQLAASVTNQIMDLDFQILIYPMSDTTRSQPSFKEFTKTPGLTEDSINWFFNNSLVHIPGYLTEPRINVMARTNTAFSPPALILVAQLDPLRDCGLAYAEKLRTAGVKVVCKVIESVPHAFISLSDTFKSKTNEAYGHIVDFIKQFH